MSNQEEWKGQPGILDKVIGFITGGRKHVETIHSRLPVPQELQDPIGLYDYQEGDEIGFITTKYRVVSSEKQKK